MSTPRKTQVLPAARRAQRAEPVGRDRLRSAIIMAVIMVGLGILLYPTTADWFSRLSHNNEISQYRQDVATSTPAERSEALRLADEYNSRMPRGPLRDPYAYESADADTDAGYAAYEQLLQVSDSGVIGRVKFAEAGIDLPIYHGTDDDVIAKGAGHLYGSSLPVGGPSTHSVLTAHSGLPSAELFTPLHDVSEDDEFWIEVLGERHWYRVDNIEIVEPDDLSKMQIIEDKDFVTLFTCTPVGVNSHRLLVRGERTEAPPTMVGEMQSDVTAGFPWWALIFVAGTAATWFLLFRKQPQNTPEDQAPTPSG